MNGPDIDGVPTVVPTTPPSGVIVGVLVFAGVPVSVRVEVGVRVGVRVGVSVGVLVGVRVGVEVLGGRQAGSVLVAPMQGPVSLTQLEPAPQNTRPPVQAALAKAAQSPVAGSMQHPVACASTRSGENNDNETTAANAHTIGPSIPFSTRFDIMHPLICRSHTPKRHSLPPDASRHEAQAPRRRARAAVNVQYRTLRSSAG